eukprot:scaffold72300_cov36-Prasinocladus_malaysianus.AAC.1
MIVSTGMHDSADAASRFFYPQTGGSKSYQLRDEEGRVVDSKWAAVEQMLVHLGVNAANQLVVMSQARAAPRFVPGAYPLAHISTRRLTSGFSRVCEGRTQIEMTGNLRLADPHVLGSKARAPVRLDICKNSVCPTSGRPSPFLRATDRWDFRTKGL